jgi:hypothetical protein
VKNGISGGLFCFQNNSDICTPSSEVLGDNSAVPQSYKPRIPKELLHEVNNQLEIVMIAAELLSRQCPHPSTKESFTQIQTAIFRTSKILKTYFKGAIPFQPVPGAVHESDMPVAVDRA